MRRATIGLLSLSIASGVGVTLGSFPAVAAPQATTSPQVAAADDDSDDLPNPLEAKRRQLRQTAITQVLAGKATAVRRGNSVVVKVGQTAGKSGGHHDQYVELAREKTDKIFVVLTEFGNQRHPDYPDQDTDPSTPGPTRFDGPLHNQIPQPDRRVDNSTNWQADYDQAHYQQTYFGTGAGVESLKTYYQKQSSGRYSVDGQVTDWVKVPYNEARYGRSNGYPCGSSVCSNTWELIKDGLAAWVADQKAAGRTDAQIRAAVKQFDQWDRYDYDGDGNFDEPDGYIDHFQIVHAGGDQADRDPYQGEDAIWSHRWYAYVTDAGLTGPAYNKLGGTKIGSTGLWVGDYTIQPENGGRSVFAHEYGHDLGLPDLYDTTGAGDNSVEYWSIMAQSRLGAKGEQSIGDRMGDFGAWEKLQLGWLDYEVLKAGTNRTLALGPHEYHSAKPQAAVVVLPKKEVTTDLGKPFAGSNMWWSTSGDNLSTSMTRTLDLRGKSTASVSLKARYDIEQDYDYLYAQVSTDGGASWTALDGTVDGRPFPKDGSDTPALTGSSGGAWVDVALPLGSAAGKQAQFRFLYRTDGGVALDGFFADEIKVVADGSTIFTDGAESGTNGWTLDGFRTTTGTEVHDYDNYYLASNRTFVSYDKYLKTGPYNFGYADSKPDWVEHYSYQDGLLLTYWDTSQPDNNTSEHPGEGQVLTVDSHPKPVYRLDGTPWRARIQVYDAPFGLDQAESMTLHYNGTASYIRGQAAQPMFDDSRTYWYADLPNHGVKVPDVGVRIRVLSQDGTASTIRVSSTK